MTMIRPHDPAAAFVPAPQVQVFVDPIAIDIERPDDAEARESLLDRAFGPARFGKTCERLRAGRLPARGLSLVARAQIHDDAALGGGAVVGWIIGTVRLWHVDAGGVPALMLGPLAVDASWHSQGIGSRLVEAAIERARALGHSTILLVGDAPYYGRFGFQCAHTARLRMPGPVERERFLGLALTPGAFAAACGLVRATGAVDLAGGQARRKLKLRRAA